MVLCQLGINKSCQFNLAAQRQSCQEGPSLQEGSVLSGLISTFCPLPPQKKPLLPPLYFTSLLNYFWAKMPRFEFLSSV